MSSNREKKQFLQMACCAMLMNIEKLPGTQRSPRALVNRAHEIWDEIEHQAPDKDDDR